jgi:O-antigen/teichoic acid export membrane protein
MLPDFFRKFITQRYLANTSWLLAERIIQMAVTLYVGVMLAVYMTEAEWGFYNWATSLVIIFAELARVGLPNIVVKFLVNRNYSEDVIMGSAFVMKLAGSTLAVLAICLLAYMLESDGYNRFLVLLAAVPYLIKSFDLIVYYFEAHVISKYTVYGRLTGVLVNNLLKLLVIIFGLPVVYVYWVFVLDAIIFISIIAVLYSKKGGSILKWKADRKVMKSLFQSSWPLIFTVLITSLYMRIDQLMIKEMLGDAANGNYASAVKLSGAWYALPWIITGSVFPAILNALRIDYDLFLKRFSAAYQMLILMALAVIIPVTLFSDEIIAVIYSGKYSESADVLKIHIWASIFVFIGYAGTKWLVAENLEKLSFVFTLFGAVVNIVLNIIVIPRFGIIGAAWATLLAQFTTYFLMPLFHAQTRIIFRVQVVSLLQAFTVVLPLINFYKLIKKR